MSRLSFASKAMPSTTVYFGLDLPATNFAGYWVEVWEDGKEVPTFELDTRPGFVQKPSSRGEILDVLNHHGCPEKYVHLIAMDLDPSS